jgi:hypothetical protein
MIRVGKSFGWLICCMMVALVGAAPAFAEEAGGGGSLSSEPLVVSGSPTEAEQRRGEYEAWLASPEARRERESSQSRFEHLSAAEARVLADSHIGGLLDTQDGGPPKLPKGQRVIGFASPYAAQVDLGSSSAYKGLVDSLAPMALETSRGSFQALDMTPETLFWAGRLWRAADQCMLQH